MTQNPYAQPPGFDTHAPVASRTSIAAILSLICAIFCVPGLGVLAIILGIAALFMIASSQGRVTGKGLAISGIFVGLLMTIMWGAIAYFLSQASMVAGQQFMGKATTFFQSVETKNYAAARTVLNTPAGVTPPTDADFDNFLAAYQAEVGTFQKMPQGMISMIAGLTKLPQFNYQQTPGQIPIISDFSKGQAVVILEIPTSFQPGGAANPGSIPVSNIGVHLKSGTTIWLIPKPGAPSAAPSTTPPAPGNGGQTPPPPPPAGNGG